MKTKIESVESYVCEYCHCSYMHKSYAEDCEKRCKLKHGCHHSELKYICSTDKSYDAEDYDTVYIKCCCANCNKIMKTVDVTQALYRHKDLCKEVFEVVDRKINPANYSI